jgi:hypothetical protein
MSRFGFVTPNDPPRASRTPKPRKNQPGHPPGPQKKCPGKSLRRRRTFFKTEKPEAASNESSTNSVINERHLKDATTLWILNRYPPQLRKKLPFNIYYFCVGYGAVNFC